MAKTAAKTPKRPERLVRLNSEIPEDLDNALRVYAATKRVSRKNVIEQALRTFLNPSSEDNRDAMIARRLQRIDQKLLTIVEGNKVTTETLGVFVQVALGLLPEPLSEAEKKEFADKVKRRFPRFIDLVTEVLAERSRGLYAHLPKQMVATPADFPEPTAGQASNQESVDDSQA